MKADPELQYVIYIFECVGCGDDMPCVLRSRDGPEQEYECPELCPFTNGDPDWKLAPEGRDK